MSRQVGAYNLTWAVAGVIAVIISGPLIEHWRAGIFLLPVMLHASTVLIMLVLLRVPAVEEDVASTHLDPEPYLLRSRKLALWLSRIALPAMYVVNFGVGAILPTLPVMRQFPPTFQTLYGSVWMGARLVVFAFLGATAFWHTRPRLLLAASVGLLLAFLLVTLAPSLSLMIGGQVLLGISMAMIYTASLYFGMVLSDGSTEHGGYHEALIGLGGVLGPGAGVVTQYLWPGDVTMAIGAVAGVVALSVIGAGAASIVLRTEIARRREAFEVVSKATP
jgi:MFS family permease